MIQKAVRFFLSGPRWWVPLGTGLLYSLALPPFNHETHPLLAFFPLLGFVILVPLFCFAVQPSFKRMLGHCFCYGYTAAFGQYYWLLFDNVEGLWYLVIIGLLFICGIVGLIYLLAALLFRATARRLPGAIVFVFPALWVMVDYGRTLGELAFPWAFLGYSLTPILPLAQMASVTGVWGLTYCIVMGNTLSWGLLRERYWGRSVRPYVVYAVLFALSLAVVSCCGWLRINRIGKHAHDNLTVSLLQANIDQFHWDNKMLDTAFAVSESLIVKASAEKPALMVLPESALLAYVSHRQTYAEKIRGWVEQSRAPLIFGALDWEKAPSGSYYDFFVYNTAFFQDTTSIGLVPYHKIRLVPFSEGIPLEGVFPILSRVNLGEADFHRGSEATVFAVNNKLRIAPFICYESLFPDFVRKRLHKNATLMVNITNDGWFGKSTGPFHHAMMARLRAIENGVPLARCANSGISMFVDPLGRVLASTRLYQRTVLTRKIPFYSVPTFYRRFGDWFGLACLAGIATAFCVSLVKRPLAR